MLLTRVVNGAPKTAPGFSVEQLIELARGVAGRNGASGPISIQHTTATRGAALALLAPKMTGFQGLDLTEPVYALLIEGMFNPPPRPPDGPDRPERTAPFSSLLLIVNADTGRITGSRTAALGYAPPDLSSVGPVNVDATETTALDGWSPWSAADLEKLRSPD